MRIYQRLLLVLVLGLLAVSCVVSTSASSHNQEGMVGQVLPVSATVKISDQMIQLEVAKTAAEQAMGLMYRDSLPDNRGMLFLFNPPRTVGFWMKNVRIPLDMVFMLGGRVVDVAHGVPPCQTEPCPIYGPAGAVDQVIELRGGRAKELGIQPGDRIVIQPHQ